MRSKILAGTIIFGLLAVIALGIVAASPNSQAATPTPTATPTPSEEAYQLTVDAIKELARLNSTSDGLIFSAVTDVVIEIMAGTRNQTPQELKAQILSGLSNPTASETLKETLRVTDPDATLVTALLNNIVINIIADKTGETAAQARARLSTPATPTPTPTPTGSRDRHSVAYTDAHRIADRYAASYAYACAAHSLPGRLGRIELGWHHSEHNSEHSHHVGRDYPRAPFPSRNPNPKNHRR